MKLFVAVFMITIPVLLVSGQFFGRFDRRIALNGIPNDVFGLRDSRQNRGPVVFPPPPQDSPVESSGVVVGASGFGFVPPSQNEFYKTVPNPSFDFFETEYF